MSFSKSPLAFDDVKSYLHQALDAPKGIKITFPTRAAAITFRSRCNHYRKRDRDASKEIYEPGNPRRGTSPYDGLSLMIDDTQVVIIKREMIELKVEVIE